ncbi:hypothetical protein ACVDG3_04310 [Meridianimarinicoccus sp. RP-17]|uniref:hypothetical protein n=1 Tax=Meridianimarinicoccus zhengii TaxID=2056810 RepID=UPI000DAC3C23|nr:hypothetical protein [Phycocomes zhengii]
MRRCRWVARIAAAVTLVVSQAAAQVELVMVEQHGCHWCAQWDAAIAPIYPKTPEGAFAPLRRIDLRAPVPEDLDLAGRAVFTPTFILVEDGRELARMEGYPGEEMFWWGLASLLRDNTEFGGEQE